jgi:hypothetical protein
MQNHEDRQTACLRSLSLHNLGAHRHSRTLSLVLQVVLFLVTSPHFRSAAVTPTLIADLSAYLTTSASPPASSATSAASMAEFKEHMMRVVESICQVSQQARAAAGGGAALPVLPTS